jgi:hypothetical protein
MRINIKKHFLNIFRRQPSPRLRKLVHVRTGSRLSPGFLEDNEVNIGIQVNHHVGERIRKMNLLLKMVRVRCFGAFK